MSGLDESMIASMNGADRRAVRDALEAAFPSRGSLERLLDGLDRYLENYAAESLPLRDTVYRLVKEAKAEGWLGLLLEQATAENPGNSQLAEVVNRYRPTRPRGDDGERPGDGPSAVTDESAVTDDRPDAAEAPTTATHDQPQAPAADQPGAVAGAADRGWDFFVSYTQADVAWAEWVAWQLDDAGYRVLIQAWDFVPGSNWRWMMENGMRDAERTIAVLSKAYLSSVYGKQEWMTAQAADPQGFLRKLIPVRIEACARPGTLGAIVSIDLFGHRSDTAGQYFLDGIQAALDGRARPGVAPVFPAADTVRHKPATEPPFPAADTATPKPAVAPETPWAPDQLHRHHRRHPLDRSSSPSRSGRGGRGNFPGSDPEGGPGPDPPTVKGRRLTRRFVVWTLGGIAATAALTAAVTSPVWWGGRPGGVLGPIGVGLAMAMLAFALSPVPRWLAGYLVIAAVEVASLVASVTHALGLGHGALRTAFEAAGALGILPAIRWVSRRGDHPADITESEDVPAGRQTGG